LFLTVADIGIPVCENDESAAWCTLPLTIYMMMRGGDGSTSKLKLNKSYCYGPISSGFSLQ